MKKFFKIIFIVLAIMLLITAGWITWQRVYFLGGVSEKGLTPSKLYGLLIKAIANYDVDTAELCFAKMDETFRGSEEAVRAHHLEVLVKLATARRNIRMLSIVNNATKAGLEMDEEAYILRTGDSAIALYRALTDEEDNAPSLLNSYYIKLERTSVIDDTKFHFGLIPPVYYEFPWQNLNLDLSAFSSGKQEMAVMDGLNLRLTKKVYTETFALFRSLEENDVRQKAIFFKEITRVLYRGLGQIKAKKILYEGYKSELVPMVECMRKCSLNAVLLTNDLQEPKLREEILRWNESAEKVNINPTFKEEKAPVTTVELSEDEWFEEEYYGEAYYDGEYYEEAYYDSEDMEEEYAEDMREDSWEDYQSDFHLFNVTFVHDTFFAIGTNGVLKRSTDGKLWDGVNDAVIGDVVWNGKSFVGVGGDQVISSRDGFSWDILGKPGLDFREEVCHAAGKFVAALSPEGIAVSVDGIAWKKVFDENSMYVRSIVSNGQRFVATGPKGCILSSADGMKWEKIDLEKTDFNMGFGSVVYANNCFLTISNNGYILRSPDGVNWKKLGYLNGKQEWSLIWDGRKYVALSKIGILARSEDGIHWRKQTLDVSTPVLSIAYGNGQYVIVGGQVMMTSGDGENWEKITIAW